MARRLALLSLFLGGCQAVTFTARIKLPPPNVRMPGTVSGWSGGVLVEAADGSSVCSRATLYLYADSSYSAPVDQPDPRVVGKITARAQGAYSGQSPYCTATAKVLPGNYWVVADYPMTSPLDPNTRYYEQSRPPSVNAPRGCLGAGAHPVRVQPSPPPATLEMELAETRCRPTGITKLHPNIAVTQDYCPTRVLAGDREFDGHGPDVTIEVTLTIVRGGRAVDARVHMHAKEVGGDGSETDGEWIIPGVYSAHSFADGRFIPILSVNGSNEVSTSVRSTPAGFQIGIPGGSNTVSTPPLAGGSFVKELRIVGDTGGNDISDDDNCADDTRFSIVFDDLAVTESLTAQ